MKNEAAGKRPGVVRSREKTGPKRQNKFRWKLPVRPSTILLVAVLAVGIGLLLYPTVSNLWNRTRQTRAIATYTESVGELDPETCAALLEAAQAYNQALFESGHGLGLADEEREEYEAQLRVDDTSIIGYIEIDAIDVYLPICLGTDEGTLQNAVGHLEGSSLPVGGESTHSVLSGHRGLPSARLFTDLDLMEIGDTFVLHVLDRTLTYEVDQILTVLPDEVDALAIEEGMDYCTLVTCTPYGVNSHRLLVRGHRVENAAADAEVTVARADTDDDGLLPLLVYAAALASLLTAVISMLYVRRLERRNAGGKPGKTSIKTSSKETGKDSGKDSEKDSEKNFAKDTRSDSGK